MGSICQRTKVFKSPKALARGGSPPSGTRGTPHLAGMTQTPEWTNGPQLIPTYETSPAPVVAPVIQGVQAALGAVQVPQGVPLLFQRAILGKPGASAFPGDRVTLGEAQDPGIRTPAPPRWVLMSPGY